jgi:hypothetical protein
MCAYIERTQTNDRWQNIGNSEFTRHIAFVAEQIPTEKQSHTKEDSILGSPTHYVGVRIVSASA